jgi:acetyltransferase-like isoleucine patch superfamily enzyme
MSYYSEEELKRLGFKSTGKDVLLSRKASLYGVSRIEIGDNTRIDDFCVLSAGEGGIKLGSYIHISCYTSLIGAGRIEVGSYTAISARVSVFSSNDDYSGEYMVNPTLPEEYTNVDHSPVTIGENVIVGAGSIILPGSNMESASALGAMSLLKGKVGKGEIYAGSPAKNIKKRSLKCLDLQRDFEESISKTK